MRCFENSINATLKQFPTLTNPFPPLLLSHWSHPLLKTTPAKQTVIPQAYPPTRNSMHRREDLGLLPKSKTLPLSRTQSPPQNHPEGNSKFSAGTFASTAQMPKFPAGRDFNVTGHVYTRRNFKPQTQLSCIVEEKRSKLLPIYLTPTP